MSAILRTVFFTRNFCNLVVRPQFGKCGFERCQNNVHILPNIGAFQHVKCFKTSNVARALPGIVVVLLRPFMKVAAFLAGRSFRKWWKTLPKERKLHYWNWIKGRKWYIAGGTVAGAGFWQWFYVTHLQETPITRRERFIMLSHDQIKELSKIEFKVLCEEYKGKILNPSHSAYTKVSHVANRLLNANKELPQIYTKSWTVTVLDDPNNVNAFVLPNGNIFVFTGMLELCSSDDELGIILGHEIAHCLLDHATENVTREQLLDFFKVLLIAVAWAILPSDLISFIGYNIGSTLAVVGLQFPYGRLLETEADAVGLQLAAKACFDIRAASAFWSKMQTLSEVEEEVDIEWLSTHPAHDNRQKRLEELMPDALKIRDLCQCPRLPASDPRHEVEAFRKALMSSRDKPIPVAVRLDLPNMATTAVGK